MKYIRLGTAERIYSVRKEKRFPVDISETERLRIRIVHGTGWKIQKSYLKNAAGSLPQLGFRCTLNVVNHIDNKAKLGRWRYLFKDKIKWNRGATDN